MTDKKQISINLDTEYNDFTNIKGDKYFINSVIKGVINLQSIINDIDIDFESAYNHTFSVEN